MFNGLNNNIIILIFFIILFNFYCMYEINNLKKKLNNRVENFTTPDDINTAVKKIYLADVEAIRLLSNFAIQLSQGGFTVPGNLNMIGQFTSEGIFLKNNTNTNKINIKYNERPNILTFVKNETNSDNLDWPNNINFNLATSSIGCKSINSDIISTNIISTNINSPNIYGTNILLSSLTSPNNKATINYNKWPNTMVFAKNNTNTIDDIDTNNNIAFNLASGDIWCDNNINAKKFIGNEIFLTNSTRDASNKVYISYNSTLDTIVFVKNKNTNEWDYDNNVSINLNTGSIYCNKLYCKSVVTVT